MMDGCVYYPNGAAVSAVLLPETFIISAKVLPLSLLILITGSLLVLLRSHHVTYTLLPADICNDPMACNRYRLICFTYMS